MSESSAGLTGYVRKLRYPGCQVWKSQPAKLAETQGEVSQMFNSSMRLATAYKRSLALQVRWLRTVENFTNDQ